MSDNPKSYRSERVPGSRAPKRPVHAPRNRMYRKLISASSRRSAHSTEVCDIYPGADAHIPLWVHAPPKRENRNKDLHDTRDAPEIRGSKPTDLISEKYTLIVLPTNP